MVHKTRPGRSHWTPGIVQNYPEKSSPEGMAMRNHATVTDPTQEGKRRERRNYYILLIVQN